MLIFLKNRHVYFIIGWLVALIVNTCNSYICELRWGMNTLVWSLTRQFGLESLTKRSPEFLLNDDIFDVIFHLLTFAFTFLFPDQDLGFRYQYNLMDAGLMLNLPPNVTRQRGVDCANLESVLNIFFLDNNLYPAPRTGPLCQCHVIQQAFQWVHHHKCII